MTLCQLYLCIDSWKPQFKYLCFVCVCWCIPSILKCAPYPVWPRMVAWCSGPLPLLSTWLTWAPFCRRNSQAARAFCHRLNQATHWAHSFIYRVSLQWFAGRFLLQSQPESVACWIPPLRLPSWRRHRVPAHRPWRGNSAALQSGRAAPPGGGRSGPRQPPLHLKTAGRQPVRWKSGSLVYHTVLA